MFSNFHLTSALIGAGAALVIALILMEPWSRRDDDEKKPGGPVDPWAIQSELMFISDQDQPHTPEINKASLMYTALIMEESGETFEAMAVALRDIAMAHEHNQVQEVRRLLADVAHTLKFRSLTIRGMLEDCPDFVVPLGEKHAVEIFDGHEDIMVVNAGFGLASGLPGAAGYAEVGESNLSKKNPDTGRIDKTADGKWIKGSGYRKPNLLRVLREHCYGFDDDEQSNVVALKGAAL